MSFMEIYDANVNAAEVAKTLASVKEEAKQNCNEEVYKRCLASVDYTTLNATDTLARGQKFAETVNNFSAHYPGIPNVAAICVYPSLVNTVRRTLTACGVKVAAVGAGFPASQTYLDVKFTECSLAVDHGADEVDIVISLCHFLDEDYDTAFAEIVQIKEGMGEAHLKVILETGALTLTQIRSASFLSMDAGADFIKTSTGKIEPAATPEAAIVMCTAIKDFFAKTGLRIGFKPAGGISTADDAVLYYTIVQHILGSEWLKPQLFRIGASRLANALLSGITGKNESWF
jgi:deoxyribose-phosphate aldolase